MLKRIVWLLVAFPAAIVLIALAVANRQTVRLGLDPFKPEAPVIALELPFYAYLFGALILGILIGGFSVWMGQGRWRRTARVRSAEASRWHAEAERLTRERDQGFAGQKQLAGARR